MKKIVHISDLHLGYKNFNGQENRDPTKSKTVIRKTRRFFLKTYFFMVSTISKPQSLFHTLHPRSPHSCMPRFYNQEIFRAYSRARTIVYPRARKNNCLRLMVLSLPARLAQRLRLPVFRQHLRYASDRCHESPSKDIFLRNCRFRRWSTFRTNRIVVFHAQC